MRVVLVTHPSSLDHRGPPDHPERPDRIGAVIDGVQRSSFSVVPVTASAADRAALLAVHDESYIDALEQFCADGGGAIDADTYAVPGSWGAALHAAGAGATAVEALTAGAGDVAFVAVRPPGHHAERKHAMGFCLFNNVAVAAAALNSSGERVAIVDWDVHHGNGTQNRFAANPDVLYVSLHQSPFYPGTGRSTEIGTEAGRGTTVNLPMAVGADGELYGEAFARIVVPVVDQFGADWMLVSAGYDAHRRDHLAGLQLGDDDYGWMAQSLAPLVPSQRTVFLLEGGYDLDALTGSVSATLNGHAGLDGRAEMPEMSGEPSPALTQIVETLAPYWDLG